MYWEQTPPASEVGGCPEGGWDPRTGQPYRFNPQTGQPCANTAQQDRVIVRQAPPPQYASAPQPSPEEQRIAAAYQRERDAMAAPAIVIVVTVAGTCRLEKRRSWYRHDRRRRMTTSARPGAHLWV